MWCSRRQASKPHAEAVQDMLSQPGTATRNDTTNDTTAHRQQRTCQENQEVDNVEVVTDHEIHQNAEKGCLHHLHWQDGGGAGGKPSGDAIHALQARRGIGWCWLGSQVSAGAVQA